MKKALHLLGIRKLLLPRPKDAGSLDTAAVSARALFGPAPQTAAREKVRDLVDFLTQIPLCEDLSRGDLRNHSVDDNVNVSSRLVPRMGWPHG